MDYVVSQCYVSSLSALSSTTLALGTPVESKSVFNIVMLQVHIKTNLMVLSNPMHFKKNYAFKKNMHVFS